jgi:hypothetical protein
MAQSEAESYALHWREQKRVASEGCVRSACDGPTAVPHSGLMRQRRWLMGRRRCVRTAHVGTEVDLVDDERAGGDAFDFVRLIRGTRFSIDALWPQMEPYGWIATTDASTCGVLSAGRARQAGGCDTRGPTISRT